MCILIDTNSLRATFNPSDDKYHLFRPVGDWVINGKGKVVYGGSKYKAELAKLNRILLLFKELKKVNRVVLLDDEKVDKEQVRCESLCNHPDFDDPHLVAIICVARLRLVATQEKRAIPFLKDKDGIFYPKGMPTPKIYSRASNADLLTDQHIAKVCMEKR